MKRLAYALASPAGREAGLRAGKTAGLTLLVLLAVVVLWRLGGWQFLELKFYDHWVRQSVRPLSESSPVVIVAVKEKDLNNPDNGCWPISDRKLAELIDRLAAAGPRAIGLDLLRPVPVPCGVAESDALRLALERHTNVVMAHNLPREGQSGTPPPRHLTGRPEQLGVVNPFPANEPNNVTRRVILYEDRGLYGTGEQRYWSLGAQLARRYMAAQGVAWEEVETGGEIWDVFGRLRLEPLNPNDGGYVGLERGGYQYLLSFAGPARFPTYSLSEVFAGGVPPEVFRGRAVLVGLEADSVQDEMSTPLNVLQPGVEVHAHTTCQLLNGALAGRGAVRFLREWQEGLWLLLAVVLGLASGMLASGLLPFLLCLTAGVAGIYFAGSWAFAAGYWIPVVLPMAGFVPVAGLVQVLRFDEERKWRQRIIGVFKDHVSPKVLELLLAQGGRLEPETLTATVFFADLKGFSTMAAGRKPQEVVAWLNEFLQTMIPPVLQRDGMVIDFIGDSVLGGFGLPIAVAGAVRKDAIAAVHAALELGEVVAGLSRRMTAAGQPGTAVRIGVSTGPVVSGIVGGVGHSKYTVIGDSVNVAARLESVDLSERGIVLTEGSFRLLVTEETWKLVADDCEGTCLGPIALKGQPEPVIVHQIHRRKV